MMKENFRGVIGNVAYVGSKGGEKRPHFFQDVHDPPSQSFFKKARQIGDQLFKKLFSKRKQTPDFLNPRPPVF